MLDKGLTDLSNSLGRHNLQLFDVFPYAKYQGPEPSDELKYDKELDVEAMFLFQSLECGVVGARLCGRLSVR